MTIKFYLAALSGLLVSFTGSAQTNDTVIMKRISDDILTRGVAYENLRFLCKNVGPRLSGSPQGAKAVQETARMMREMGADTVFLQECMVPHWVRGEKETAKLILANGKEYALHATALGNYPMNPTYVKTFQAYGEAGVYRGNGPVMAAKYGAVGVITRSLASNPDDHPHTGATRYVDSIVKLPAIAISTNDADYLSSALKKRMVSQVYFKTSCKMLEDVLSHNVVGEIRGSEFPDEIITVGGHIDSWDLAEGAHDDGAGCVQSMEVIRAFKALNIRPKRTIRVVMFQNEENGLRGGAKYAELAKADKKKYIFALESDAGGFTPRGFGVSGTDAQKRALKSYAPLFSPYGVSEITDGGGGADIGPLRPLGTAMAGLSPDSQRYFDIHHAETDVFEAVSRRELLLGATVMAQLIYLVSEHGL